MTHHHHHYQLYHHFLLSLLPHIFLVTFIIIVIIIIIIIIRIIIGTCNYIPETTHTSKVHYDTAVLYFQSVLPVMLFLPCYMFCTFTLALPAVCVQCQIWQFVCNTLNSCFPGMLLGCCLSDFEMVPVAPVITDVTFAFTFHMR